MRLPYELAWPIPKKEANSPIYLLPGNHDWYDGLVNFLAVFCREKGTTIGGWKASQRRSYFAVKITEDWWIWGIDIALVRDMDQPQSDYFETIASVMKEGAKIILCSAEPGWYSAEAQGRSYKSLSYAALLAKRANRDLKVPLILSGDSHHYSRYSGEGTHYITSGGGGAFLHGTLELKPKIEARWLQSPREQLELQACYPSKEESKILLLQNANFGRLNPGLTRVLAGMYVVCVFVLTYAWRIDVAFAILLLLGAGLWGYSCYQEKHAKKTLWPAVLHALSHFAIIVGFAWLALWISPQLSNALEGVSSSSTWVWLRGYFPVSLEWLAWFVGLAVPGFLVGPWIAGKIFGLNLYLGCRFFDISHNDAFSAMRLDSHRHFIRICIRDGQATIYPIKLENVPGRHSWRKDNSPQRTSMFVAQPPLNPELIESPIFVQGQAAVSTSEVAPPTERKE